LEEGKRRSCCRGWLSVQIPVCVHSISVPLPQGSCRQKSQRYHFPVEFVSQHCFRTQETRFIQLGSGDIFIKGHNIPLGLEKDPEKKMHLSLITHREVDSGSPSDIKILRCSSPLHKMGYYSFLYDQHLIQCKFYTNSSCAIMFREWWEGSKCCIASSV
jgi:hypothetical protein